MMTNARLLSFLTVACAFLVFGSCGRKDSAGLRNDTNGSNEKPRPGMVVVQSAPVYMIPEGTPPEDVKSPKSLTWAFSADFGTKLKTRPDARSGYFAITSESLQLVPVTLEVDAELISCWLRPGDFVDVDAEPSVVVEPKVFAREGPFDAAPVVRALSRLDLVAVDVSKSGQYVKAYLPSVNSNEAPLVAHLPRKSVSQKDKDIGAAILVQRSRQARTDSYRKELLEKARDEMAGSTFREDIAGLLKPAQEKPVAVEVLYEELVAPMSVNHKNAMVYSEPSINSTVVSTLDFDVEVLLASRTVDRFDIGNGKARWYQISAPVQGWIHGMNLEGAD